MTRLDSANRDAPSYHGCHARAEDDETMAGSYDTTTFYAFQSLLGIFCRRGAAVLGRAHLHAV
jgi:hypothetical protein